MTREQHAALAAKALAWVSRQFFTDHELEAFIIATLDESTGLVFPQCDGCGVPAVRDVLLCAECDQEIAGSIEESARVADSRDADHDISLPDCTGDVHRPYCRKYSAAVPVVAEGIATVVAASTAEEAPSSVTSSPATAVPLSSSEERRGCMDCKTMGVRCLHVWGDDGVQP